MKAISLRLEPAQYHRLRALSFSSQKPMAEIIREAINAHLERQPIKPGQEWFWTAEWQALEREAGADLAAGRYETFDSIEQLLASLE